MNNWRERGEYLLNKSLSGLPIEQNELDWKSALSDKTERLAQHLSAFTNQANGGYLVFGVSNDGIAEGIQKQEADDIVKKLGNMARNALSQPIGIEHTIVDFKGAQLLLIYIPENADKPVHPRSGNVFDSYKRSAGQTVKMSDKEVKQILALSQGISFEEQIAESGLTSDGVLKYLDYDSFFTMMERRIPDNKTGIMDVLANENLIRKSKDNLWEITNLGAILFARNLGMFKSLKRKAVRVVVYKGVSKIDAIREQEGAKGYATGFEGLVQYIMGQLPTNEVIEEALRKQVKMYPEKAIREFVANALIHQDFSVTGSGVMIEIFSDRIEITNPGVPLVDVNRFIDTAPKSRNEILASLLRRLKICEERGSGIDRAIEAIEEYQLPAPKFIRGDDYTRVIVYAHQTLTQMDKEDRVRACYQHCVLNYVNNQPVNNQSIRMRFNISKNNVSSASKILAETIEAKLIKPNDPDSDSKKFVTYIPYWA